MDLDTNAHSVFSLYYHLILVTKYRFIQKLKILSVVVFTENISERAKEIFEYIAPNYKLELVEWNHDGDHIHVLFKAQPKTELTKFINAYKSASSRLLKKEFPEIKQRLWKEMFWSRSICLLSSGGTPIEVIQQYIRGQGEKNDKKT